MTETSVVKVLIISLNKISSGELKRQEMINAIVANAPRKVFLMFSRGRERVHWKQMG